MNIMFHESPLHYKAEYQQVRAALISNGTSLNEWCIQNGVNRQLAYRALKGMSFGRQAIELRVRIIREVLQTAA
jgi:hypothetical protein